jgi:hypothetical protein
MRAAAQFAKVGVTVLEIIEVAEGLWVWRTRHPDWSPGYGWDPIVASTCVRSDGVTLLLDPVAPPPDATDFWARIDADPPDAVVVLKPDQVLPALRELLALPYRHVIVSHGAPVHERAEFERALPQPPWGEG